MTSQEIKEMGEKAMEGLIKLGYNVERKDSKFIIKNDGSEAIYETGSALILEQIFLFAYAIELDHADSVFALEP